MKRTVPVHKSVHNRKQKAGSLLGTGLWPWWRGQDLNLRPLGYEASGNGLRRLGRSSLCHLTSARVWEVVVYGGPRLLRLSRSRHRLSRSRHVWVYRLVYRREVPRVGAGRSCRVARRQ
jgi:hypothetical protein